MLSRGIALLAMAWFVLFAQSAQAFFDPPWITPENPVPGETVYVNIRGGVCDGIFEEPGYPQIAQEGNAIRMRWYGDHWPEGSGELLCSYPTGTFTPPVGAFPAGDYVLTVELAYRDFFGVPGVYTIGTVPFTVAEAPVAAPIALPALDATSVFALVVVLLGLGLGSLRARRAGFLVVALVFLPLGARAQDTTTIRVLLSNAPGAPTPAAMLAWVNSSLHSGKPPLEAFKVKSPQAGDYLLPDRATGDFLAWLNANPNSARAKLEASTLLTFPSLDAAAALTALRADPYVAEASEAPEYAFSSVGLIDFGITPDPEPLGGGEQYGFFDMNVDRAWLLAGGYALVGQIDMGLYENHQALRQWSGSSSSSPYVGGNFVKTASRDVGLTGRPAQTGFDPLIVDEMKPMWIAAGSCTAVGALLPPAILGHGTHAAGLIAANDASGLGVQGTCKHCGIQMYKVTYLACVVTGPSPQVVPRLNADGGDRAKTQAVDTGVQALSMSFGASYNGLDRCGGYVWRPECLSLAYATARDVTMVAASGNQKVDLNFPASDKRVVSAGGFQQNLALWDEAPTCPPAAPSECGSNYSTLHSSFYFTHQETLGSAKRVLSTTYPNTTWVDYAECGDGYGTPMGDGLGWCTGTSMSAPQIAGVMGLLRSINPLVPTSDPEPVGDVKPGLRTVLAQTGARAQQGLGWDPKTGYGIPDVAAAARRVLGKVAGVTVRNRVTPLFRLYQATTKDFADTSSPQYALSLMINQDKNYVQPVSGLGAASEVPGYAFPYDKHDTEDEHDNTWDTTLPAAPRAAVYVLTTEYRPRTEWPELRPLHLMDKARAVGRDYLLATTKDEIEAAHRAGYSLRTIQGYIYQPCTPEPACIPPAAQKLWREYKTADADCAVFLESERNAFEAAHYTDACPTGATKMIGYAYPDTDSDHDGLPDGFEYVVGTNPYLPDGADSDGDGQSDAKEFPLTGIATGDPCMGGTLGARNCGANQIFKNGFE